MTEADLGYIAGFLDGEGCISLNQVHGKDRTRTRTFVLRIRITNTNKEVLDWIQASVGNGRIRSMKVYNNNKPAWEWYLANKHAADFLTLVYPFLKVKRLQAEIGLKYVKTISGDRKGSKKLSDEVVIERRELREQMLQANNRSGLYN